MNYNQIMDIHAVCPVGPDLSDGRGIFKNSIFMRCPIKYPRACKICFRSYSSRSSFSNHKKYCKPPSDDDSNKNNSSTYICKTCNKSYTTYSGVFKHNRICEKELNRKTYHLCPLPDCAAKFRHVSHINRHLADSHGFQMNLLSEEHKFKSVAEFEFWLNREEVKTCTLFKKCSGSVIKNNKTYSYYVCHFYPRRESKSVFLTEDSVKPKIHPSIMCPARVMVHEESECVKAIFYRRHNHEVFQKCEISTPETEL